MDTVTLYTVLLVIVSVVAMIMMSGPCYCAPMSVREPIDVINTLPPTLYVSGVTEAKAAIHPTGPSAINLSKVAIQRQLASSL